MLNNRRCRTQASALHFRVGIAMLSCTKNWPICNWIYNAMNKIDNTYLVLEEILFVSQEQYKPWALENLWNLHHSMR
jgi:hypothetical protein